MTAALVILLVQVVVVQGLVTAMLALMPRFMRPDVFFAVTVRPGFAQSAEGQRIRKQYQRRVVLSGCGAIVLVLALFPVIGDMARALMAAAGTLYLVVVTIWAFVSGRRQVQPHAVAPTSVREAGLAPRKELPVSPGALWVGPFLIIAAAVAFLALRYDALPERIPMHYNAAGQVDRYATKSVGSVFGLLIVASVVCLLMALITWSMGRGIKRARATGPAAERQGRMLTLTAAILLVVQYFIAMLFSAIAVVVVLPPEQAGKWVMVFATVGTVGLMGLILGILVRYRGAGAGVGAPAAGNGAPVGDGTPDANWKWGMIYYNPEDPALWVEKRFGIGYTTNMAHPGAWVLLGGVLLSLVAIVALAVWAGK